MKSIHLATARRLLLGWLCVSLLIGGASYWFGLRQMGLQLIEQARGEGEKVTPAVLARINGSAAQRAELQNLLASHAMEGFLMLALYDREGHLVARKLAPGANPVLAELRLRGRLPLGRNREFQSDYSERGGQGVIRIVMPLAAGGRLAGHIEAIREVPPERLALLKQHTRQSLLLVLLVVTFTTLLLYPFIISLDRKLRAHARQIMLGDLELMEVLGSAIARRDTDTGQHNYRVTFYALRLAEHIGLSTPRIRELMAGAFLHDIGKIGIPDAILHKSGPLSEDEYSRMKEHVSLGLEITSPSSWLGLARDVIAAHHECFDGSGYPEGLAGEAIPLTARIFAIADVFDALTSQRPYKPPFSVERSLAILKEQSGSHFDPVLLAAFLEIAPRLHAQVSGGGRDALERALSEAIPRYWDFVL
ncbi:HD-GYP domain-containing protein [Niveibacterium terrae]|uniref:HD-GYP domain-containing protein n=1 Tax=Niveibacterium terrae TaxID=3373598 RepID=UPI003A8D1C68